jgi:hypothetical protein
MSKKITLTELKKHLRKKSDAELVEEIAELYKKFDTVKEYYRASFFNDDEAVLQKYKDVITEEFFPRSLHADPKARLSVARKAVRDYKKVGCSDSGYAEIMLHYVEVGIEFTNTYGDIDSPFYSSMVNMYFDAADFIKNHSMETLFQERLYKMVLDTQDCGWGFHDSLVETYLDVISSEE